LNIQDQNQWGQTIYSKPQNKIIGLVFSGSTFTQWGNTAPAALNINFNSNPIFESCTFTNNSSQYVFNIDQSAPLFNNCLIINNTTQNGIFNIQYVDTNNVKTKVPKFANSIFVNNTSFSNNCCGTERGLVIFNSIITENGYSNNFNEKLTKFYYLKDNLNNFYNYYIIKLFVMLGLNYQTETIIKYKIQNNN